MPTKLFKNLLLLKRTRLIFVLCVATGVSVASPPVSISTDAWLTENTFRRMVTIHQPLPARPVRMRIPYALDLDLNIDSGALCGRGLYDLWKIDLATRQLIRFEVAANYSDRHTSPVVAGKNGECATLVADTTLLVLGRSGRTDTVRLDLPEGMETFDWKSVSYDDMRAQFLLTGAMGYAVVPADVPPRSVEVKQASGKIAQGSIENTEFLRFRCCARLGVDGKTLFSIAHIRDEDMTGYTSLVAVDVDSGSYKRMYLPFSPVWYRTGQHASRFDPPWLELGSSMDSALWAVGRRSQLTLSGFADLDASSDTQYAVFTVETDSGNVEVTPRRQHEAFVGLTQSGRYMLWKAWASGQLFSTVGETVVTDIDRKEIMRHPGKFAGVAHAQNAETRISVHAVDEEILTYISVPTGKFFRHLARIPEITAWLRQAEDLSELRLLLMNDGYLRDSKTGKESSVRFDEFIVYAQGLPLPRPDIALPQLNKGESDEAREVWSDYAEACDSYAAKQGQETELAMLQCLVAPW